MQVSLATMLSCVMKGRFLEAEAEADAEAKGYIVVGCSEVVPELEAVVVAGVGRTAIGITCSYPEIR